MAKRMNHQSDTSLKSDISESCIAKLDGENNEKSGVANKGMQSLRKFSGILGCYGFATAIGVGFVAYSATHIYVYFCAPSGIMGFIQSLVVMDSTFCHVVMGMINHSQSLYGGMIIAFLFSLIGAMGKGVAWMTGGEPGEVPTTIQSKPLLRR